MLTSKSGISLRSDYKSAEELVQKFVGFVPGKEFEKIKDKMSLFMD